MAQSPNTITAEYADLGQPGGQCANQYSFASGTGEKLTNPDSVPNMPGKLTRAVSHTDLAAPNTATLNTQIFPLNKIIRLSSMLTGSMSQKHRLLPAILAV